MTEAEQEGRHGAGETAQWVREPAALAKDLGSIPSISMEANNCLSPPTPGTHCPLLPSMGTACIHSDKKKKPYTHKTKEKKVLLIYVCVCLTICYVCTGTYRGQKRASDPWNLELNVELKV